MSESSLLNEATFASDSRLYEFTLHTTDAQQDLGTSGLLMEAFAAQEGLQDIGFRDVILLSTHANIDLPGLLMQSASLQVSLADGSRIPFSGLINQAELLGSDGGLTRYRLRLVPWLWLLTQRHTSRVWQDKTVIEIVESIFTDYPSASWAWSEDVSLFLSDTRPRSYCIQYRETDFAFVQRLLTEEGLSYRFAELDSAPAKHQVVFFADSTQLSATPEDATSLSALGGAGIRFHGGRTSEEQDSIQAWGAKRQLNVALTTILSHDYKAKQAIAASVPTHHQYGGSSAPVLESYDTAGAYTYASQAEAQRYARLQQEAHEARNKLWLTQSTVRSLRAGTRFSLTQSPLQNNSGADQDYVVLRLASIGINNLPKLAQSANTEFLNALPELLLACVHNRHVDEIPLPAHRQAEETEYAADPQALQQTLAQAQALGYANTFTALRADIPWRPVLENTLGLRQHPRATALGSQSAIVVGANGETSASGADEIHCDRLGRVRIRFHWQNRHDDSNATCWVRVAQRSAGGGMGSQFLPRIGQEVQVQFIEGDIDRPIVIGALYHGQGEGGTLPTPGGQSDQAANLKVFESAHDHQVSAQGNLAGGHSPVWHGASGDRVGHNNASALWGIRSKEFGGLGYNQLLLDDTDNQGRVQLKTTQAATELNLGHLIHHADNFRGSFRGLGAELRTDAYGALRAGKGLLVTSYPLQHNASQRDPAGDNVAGMAHLKQAAGIVKSFSEAAKTHQTVQLASHLGSTQANQSQLANEASAKPEAPLKAQHTAVSGMVNQNSLSEANTDAQNKNTAPDDNTLPHSTDPLLSLTARGDLSFTAGQDLQLNNGENVHVITGQDSQFNTGHQFRLHTGQAIGMLGGASSPGQNQIGLQLIAAQQPIDIQAQSDELKIQARDNIDIKSSHAHIDWAAAKSISLSTAGGANITIEGGNITVQCPGKITIYAGKKSFLGPERLTYPLPVLPHIPKEPCAGHYQIIKNADMIPLEGYRYRVELLNGQQDKGLLSSQGLTKVLGSNMPEPMNLFIALLKENQKITEPYAARANNLRSAFQSGIAQTATTQFTESDAPDFEIDLED